MAKFKHPHRGVIAALIYLAFFTVLPASAAIQFEEVTVQSGVAKITTSYGGAWGNLNGDVYPDLYLNNHARMNSLYINGVHDDLFYDVAGQVQYWKTGRGGNEDVHGGSWADYDNDGDDDLLVSTGICCNPQFFENQNGTLVYKSLEKGFGNDPDKGGRMPIWFDYNQDGVLETSIMTFYGAPTMQLQNGVYTKLPLADFKCIQNQYGVLIDITGDGKLDVICVHRGSNFPERALDISTYPPLNISGLLPPATLVNDIVIGDFDNNLRNDMLLLRGVLRPSQIKVFDGNKIEGIFVEIDGGFSFKSSGSLHVRLERGGEKTANESGIYIGAGGVNPGSSDFVLNSADEYVQGIKPFVDNGAPELYIGYDAATERWMINQYLTSFGRWVTTYFELESETPISNLTVTGLKAVDGPVKPVYISNLPQGLTNTTTSTVFNTPIQCVGGTAADFDNDMDQDIYMVCRGGVENLVNRMYQNNGNGTFTLLPDEGGARSVTGVAVADRVGTGEGVMAADYNLDGLVDMVVTNGLNMVPHNRNGGPNQLFRNVSSPRNWVLIDLVGTISNRNGIGARVLATAGGKTQLREQNGGFHRWAQDHQRIHFGLADNTTTDIEVRWPSGRVETFEDLPSNELYRITEAEGIEVVDRDIEPDATVAACGKPSYSKGSEAHLFIWKDCGGTEKWNLRATGGGSTKTLQYTGVVRSVNGFSGLEPFSFETGDVLQTNPADTLNYTFKMLNSGEDGGSFAVNPGEGIACFEAPTLPSGAKIFLGSTRIEMTAPFDLNTLGSCDGNAVAP